jgi:tight adherence protein B
MDSAQLISLISFASLASGCGAILLGVRELFTRRGADAALRRELKRLPKLRDDDADGGVAAFDVWFERTLYMSNCGMTPIEGVLLIFLAALAGGGAAFVATDSEVATLLTVLVVVCAVLLALVVMARRRLTRFEEQFPMALDLLARAVRAGESFDQGLLLVGDATEDPVGTELKRCAKQLEMGLSMQTCMSGLMQRVQLMDVRIFANAVGVHREAGGNLSITLERLAEVIRERQSYHRQLRSLTGAGRISTLIVAALGPLLFAYLFVLQPEYGHRLVDDPMGRWMLVISVVLQVTGIVWVMRLLKPDY